MAEGSERFAPWAVLLLTAAVFGPGLAAGFVWDDLVLVVRNELTGDLSNFPRFFAVDLWESSPVAEPDSGYYRPLVLLDFALDRAIFGLSAAAHHAHGLLWHLLGVGLLWRVLRRVGLSSVGAAVGAALFAVHPAQVEAVMFISARNDLMAAAFLFAAVLLLERDRPTPGQLLGGAACVLAGLLSKETVLLAPALVALFAFARTGRPGPPRSHGAILAALGVYAGLRGLAGVALPAGASVGRMAELVGPVGAWYARVLVWPIDLAPGVHVLWAPSWPWWALGVAGLLSAGLVWGGGRRGAAGLGLAGLTLAPVLAAIARAGSVPDRYLYLPLAGLGLALGATVDARLGSRGRVAALVAVLLLGGAGASRLVPEWRDEATLWSVTVERFPNQYTYAIYAKFLEDEGDLDGAARFYGRAVQPPVPYRMACFNASNIHLKRGDPGAAAAAGEAALAAGCSPSPELVAPMAVGLAATGRWADAEDAAAGVASDPTGKAVVVRAAAAARRGDLGPLRDAAAVGEGDPLALYRQVAWLLHTGGEEAAAREVQDAAP